DSETVAEMNKDVSRLSMIASRFSKIGSKPQMTADDLNSIVEGAAGYMATRISSRIRLTTALTPEQMPVLACRPLLEWVLENLIKNAVDAMEADGSIDVGTGVSGQLAWIEVRDSGKGISRKNFKKVFSPGFTTKKRGWGLGLTLAKRIIEQYHQGRIFVKSSIPGQSTTFRIEIPLCESDQK
ncbi:MAG: ATP-binding protein, partial [Muribaculaceae bacterium]|nr:ATP-binding protein [Muribaculaceae bacterium]